MPLKDYRSLIFWWGQRLAWPQVVLYSKFLSAGFTTPQWPSFENRMSFGSKKGVQRYTWSDVQGWWETPQKNWASLAAQQPEFFCSTELFLSTCGQVMIIIPRSSVITKTSAPWASRGFLLGCFGRWKMKTWNRFPLAWRFWLKMFKQSKALH